MPNIFTTLGLDYDDRVLPSITNEVLKAVVAQFDAGELITQREMVNHMIMQVVQMTGRSPLLVPNLTALFFVSDDKYRLEIFDLLKIDLQRKSQNIDIVICVTGFCSSQQ